MKPTLIPANLLITDWDQRAKEVLTDEQVTEYKNRTAAAREKWETAKAVYRHNSRSIVPTRDGRHWGSVETTAAARFLDFQQTLWAVLVSLRAGNHKPKQG